MVLVSAEEPGWFRWPENSRSLHRWVFWIIDGFMDPSTLRVRWLLTKIIDPNNSQVFTATARIPCLLTKHSSCPCGWCSACAIGNGSNDYQDTFRIIWGTDGRVWNPVLITVFHSSVTSLDWPPFFGFFPRRLFYGFEPETGLQLPTADATQLCQPFPFPLTFPLPRPGSRHFWMLFGSFWLTQHEKLQLPRDEKFTVDRWSWQIWTIGSRAFLAFSFTFDRFGSPGILSLSRRTKHQHNKQRKN